MGANDRSVFARRLGQPRETGFHVPLLRDIAERLAFGAGSRLAPALAPSPRRPAHAQARFAWSGPLTHTAGRNGSAYYRIQGPKLLIEFSPQGVGGDATVHVHTVYRDPTNDYGAALTSPR